MKFTTKELTSIPLFTALIIVGAFLKIDIPLPLYTMHFTFQWLFVLMAGFILGKKNGTISVILYIIIGLAGVPVFAAGGGINYIFRPGFGFLLGFVLAAFIIGLLTDLLKADKFLKLIIPALAGMIVYYGIGAIYFYLMKNFYAGVPVAFGVVVVDYCLITVIPDFILCVIAVLLTLRLKPLYKKIMKG